MENMENQTGNTEQQGNAQETEKANQEKTFTQEEVNRIVQERLARVKTPQEPDAREQELQQREAALYAREQIIENNLPNELLEEFKGMNRETIDKCIKVVTPYIRKAQEPILNAVGPTGETTGGESAIRKAMGLQRK